MGCVGLALNILSAAFLHGKPRQDLIALFDFLTYESRAPPS